MKSTLTILLIAIIAGMFTGITIGMIIDQVYFQKHNHIDQIDHPPIESCLVCIIPINDTIENWCFDTRRITITSGTGIDIYQVCPLDSNRYHINMPIKHQKK